MTTEVQTNPVDQIATALSETNRPLLRNLVAVIGAERALAALQTALDTEAAGGLMIANGKRRRTPGGVFFYQLRGTMSKTEQRQVWPRGARKKPGAPGHAPSSAPSGPVMSWEEALNLLSTINQPGEARTVKMTLIGRPLNINKQPTCVIVALKGKEPTSLPKGLPTPPANSAITWAVFIASKQWAAAGPALDADPEDRLIIEGYPLIDPKSGKGVVLAMSCKTIKTAGKK